MYLAAGILFILCLIFFIINFYRRKKIICKLCCMDTCQKIKILNELAEPFGFIYLEREDIITARTDAWQHEFGYHSLFDRSAPRFHMIFDCEPIYFNYQGRTWMIELWKGQYGINTGGEIGIYHADTILTPEQFDSTLFSSVSAEQMLPISMQLYLHGRQLFSWCYAHWWLTGFCMGMYCEPENLTLRVSITCRDCEMLTSLTESLLNSGYKECDLCICDMTISFTFSIPHCKQPRADQRFICWMSRWQNRLFCHIYLQITRPFTCTLDRLLYLYYFLPFAFRHMLLFRRNRRQKLCKKKHPSHKMCKNKLKAQEVQDE